MGFGKLILIAVVGVVLYTWGLPDPLKEFFSNILDAYILMCFRTMVATIRLCSSYADYLQEFGQTVCIQEFGQDVCKDGLCPAYAPLYLAYKQQAAYSGARLLRQLGNFLNAQGIEFLSHSIGDTLAPFAMWLAVHVA
ncbi:hypothetical protein LA080_007801 [Diaporthe eres]|nr:hypothetical protein LA080_007801 [Diaporthe eres]